MIFEHNVTLVGLCGIITMEAVEMIPLTLLMPEISTQTALELIDLMIKGLVAIATIYTLYRKRKKNEGL